MRLRTLSTLVGVCAGVATLTASLNYSEASKKILLKKIEGLSPNILLVWNTLDELKSLSRRSRAQAKLPREKDLLKASQMLGQTLPLGKPLPLSSADAVSLQKEIPEIHFCSPVIKTSYTQLMPHTPREIFSLIGGTPSLAAVFNMKLSRGRFFTSFEDHLEKRVCVLGEKAAQKMVGEGTLTPGSYIRIYDISFKVIGIIEKAERSSLLKVEESIVIPYRSFLKFCGVRDQPNFLAIRLKPLLNPKQVISRIETVLMRHRESPTFRCWDQRDFIQKKKQMIRTLEWLVNSVPLLILLIACISCANLLMMSVHERTAEIGLRIALGATKKNILCLFLREGFILMMGGGLLGLFFGFILTQEILKPLPQWIEGMQDWHFHFLASTAMKSLGVLFFCAFGASLLPAVRASRLEPTQALRG